MNHTIRNFFIVVPFTLSLITAVCAQTLPIAAPEDVGLSNKRLERIGAVMDRLIGENRIAGAVTLVSRRGKIAHLETHGMADKENGKPMSEDTIFALMSMTKPITSLAVLMLYEEGKFLLTDPVSKYIPGFRDMRVVIQEKDASGSVETSTIPAKQPITIRHLLLHTAGLSYGSGSHAAYYKKAGIRELRAPEHTIEELTIALAKLPLLFHPGENYTYSLSDEVLGYFIEVITGKSFDRFLQERIFKPLGMNDTFFYVPEAKKNRLAALYKCDDSGTITKQPPNKKFLVKPLEQRFFPGGEGLYSTVHDYARFCQMLLNGGILDGVRLVSRKTVEMMTTNGVGDIDPNLPEGGDKWGLGGMSVRTKYHTDVGILSPGCYLKTGAYTTEFWVDPSEEMFGILLIQLQPMSWEILHLCMVLATQAIID
ncbi:serine hydrolase domain-containing protein [Candidatus Omnitrophota bacterium]